jgi:hypothetical protein
MVKWRMDGGGVHCQWHMHHLGRVHLTCRLFLRPCGVQGGGVSSYASKGEVIMARKTSVLGFSVTPALAKEYERLAEREGTTKSDLFRRMVITYKAEREEEEFVALQRKMARRTRKTGVLTEEEVERIVFEDR